LRVLHLNAGNLYGGIETLLCTLAELRHETPDIEPHFGICFDGLLGRTLRDAGATVHLLGEARLRKPLSVRRARRNLERLLESQRFDVAVCHSSWAQVILGPPIQAAGTAFLRWLHAAPRFADWLELLARRFTPDFLICNSRFTAGPTASFYAGVPQETWYAPLRARQADPAPAETRQAVRAELRTPLDDLVIVQAGRMERGKGHEVLLAALARMAGNPHWTYWQVGGAQRTEERRYVERLRARAADLGIASRVNFIGHRADTARVLSAADVYCQPNTSPESFGLVFVEALQARLPVVTTAIGGALEIVDASCGVLVPTPDPVPLAQVLERLLGDRALRERLSNAGPLRAIELCEPTRQLEQLASVLRRLARLHPSRQAAAPLSS
jgi:glycosyltransferase involved in cell wall biosynthesis